VKDSIFRGNDGPGLWLDESVYDMTVTGNEMRNNSRHGASLEISAKAVFANNIVTDNGGFGVKINNTSDVTVVNNTFSGNDRSINLVQDARRPTSATTAGRDKRQPFPDPTMTWLVGPATVLNNVIADQSSGNCMLCVEDYSQQRSAAQMGVTANSNVYYRPDSQNPANLVVWSRGPGNPAVYPTLLAFRLATAQEVAGQLIDGVPLLGAVVSVADSMATNAQPLTATLGRMIGMPTGTRHLGAFNRA
jgi:parallel beta-helix repeat protein